MTVPRPWDPGRPHPPLPPSVPEPDRTRRRTWETREFALPEPLDPVEGLARRRILLLVGRLDVAAAETAAARLMLADAEGSEPIRLQVACPDAEMAAAVLLADTLRLVTARTDATATGVVGGPAVAVFAAARVRRARTHARFALFEPREAVTGPADRLAGEADLRQGQLDFCVDVIAAAAGRDPVAVAADIRSGRRLSAAEAVGYGLVQELSG